MFIQHLVSKSGAGQVKGSWFEEWWNKKLDDDKVKKRKSKALEYKSGKELEPQKSINDLVFQALGSTKNRADFVLCDSEINTYKMRTWMQHNYMDLKKFDKMLEEFKRGGEPSAAVISVFRTVRANMSSDCACSPPYTLTIAFTTDIRCLQLHEP